MWISFTLRINIHKSISIANDLDYLQFLALSRRTDRHTERHTYIHTETQTYRQTDRQIDLFPINQSIYLKLHLDR